MNKLVDFLSPRTRKKKVQKKGKGSSRMIELSASEKTEIAKVIPTLTRETSRILISHILQEESLSDLVQDLNLEELSHYTTSSEEETNSRPPPPENEDSPALEPETEPYGTFRMSDMKEAAEYNSGTFCVKDLKEEGSNSGTFCINSLDNSTPEEDTNYGTFCCTSNDPGTFNPAKQDVGAASAPDFGAMFREPENWEKHILALEKGEWTQGMEQNGAFKRWKKERPAMPSIYLREGSG